ncbi:MAG: lytic murein transglycosylase [Cytophagales bacterium]|nr:lytic murein transglycosylase [Cytophagales bacterium]
MKIFILLLAVSLNLYTNAALAKKRAQSHASQQPISYATNAQAQDLAKAIAERQQLDVNWVLAQMKESTYQPRVVKLMQPLPAGGKKNWSAYRDRFVTPAHINAGVAFWRANQDVLLRAEAEYGVPPHMVLGILGVETIYGRNTGGFRVLDALATLAFDYPSPHPRREARVAYFQSELEQFLVLAKQANLDPKSFKGSYAGAMGLPQFMPSSWRKHAVDFDGDGKVDLWQSPSDAVGSVANYFKNYGWKNSSQIMPISVELENGVNEPTQYPADENFFVITQYNNSYYYAAAVIELGNAIAAEIARQKP